ncbi:MAG: hypothetical protein P8P29_04365 [Flavobacteriaceae bacterium]|nr:hypothetical protein [Flavobacteriaceae bacterium]
MAKRVTGNPEKDFFEQNPEIKYMDIGHEVLKREGKVKASKVMWAIYLSEDPESQLYRIPIAEKRKNIEDRYLSEVENFDWNEIEYAIRMYPRFILTKEQGMYKIWGDKLDELTTHLKSLDITSDDEKVIKIMEKTEKIWGSYEKVKTKMIDTIGKSQLHGSGTESKRESRSSRRKK